MKVIIAAILLIGTASAGCAQRWPHVGVSDELKMKPPERPCGVDRWDVKVLADTAGILRDTVLTTVGAQARIVLPPQKGWESRGRDLSEDTPYIITGYIVGGCEESDNDYHLELVDSVGGINRMIIEIPSPNCPRAEPHRAEYGSARLTADSMFKKKITWRNLRALPFPVHVRVIGFGFNDDVEHGRPAHIKRTVWREIHPVLKIEVLNSKKE